MKVRNFNRGLFLLILGIFLLGSAGFSFAGVESGCGMVEIDCGNSGTNAKLQSGEYQKKVDNFLILQDTSSSMGEVFPGSAARDTKIEYSKGLVNCLNNTLPDNFNVDAGLRSFGYHTADIGLIYGMGDYTKAGMADGIKAITGTAGVTPIGKAINHGSMDIKGASGQTAVILFSDGINTAGPDPVAAAAAMKDMYGSNVCIYTVQIGHDPIGQKSLEAIADAGKCGFATNGSAIGDANGMDKFVTDVFLTKAMKPMRPAEMISITLLIEFDFDKDVVRPQYHDDIAKVANELKKFPGATAQLEGHTDSMGSDAYNMSLSKRRAESVKRYLVEKFGVDAVRISTVGYGESKPVATNDTAAGRQKNRRVVANIK